MQSFMNNYLYRYAEVLNTWVLRDLPAALMLILSFFILRLAVGAFFRQTRNYLLQRAELSPDTDTEEAGKRINTLISIASGAVRILLWFLLLMLLLPRFGVNVGPILASAGILGLAIGFGAQELVRDVISGFFILLENQIRTGDVAVINGTGGVVEKIELRTTCLRDASGVVHVFQNGKINSLSNMTKEWSAIVLDIGVAYKEDVRRVMQVMQEVGDELQALPEWGDKIIAPIEVQGLNDFADSALVIRARIKTRPIQQWAVGREYRRMLKERFDKEDIEIPFPHRKLIQS
ncbi:mechanosensitive ion channel family protein [Spirochaeta dissipatitropha]